VEIVTDDLASPGGRKLVAARPDVIFRYLRGICRELGRPRVLDLGCATAQVLLRLLPAIQYGVEVDISGATIKSARRGVHHPHSRRHFLRLNRGYE